jgi:hypothetical protein
MLKAKMPEKISKSARVIFLVLLFPVLIVAGVAWVSFGDCADIRRSYHTIILGDKDYIDREVRFRVWGDGTSLLPNGRLAGFRTVRASDCVKVSTQAEGEGSPLQAEDEFKRRIRGASQVIERGPIVDTHGELIGERVILLVQERPRTEIISEHKNDGKLFVIRSASLAHAVAYEKLIQNGYRIDRDGYVIAQGK